MTQDEVVEELTRKVSITMLVVDWQAVLGAHGRYIEDSEFVKRVDELVVKRLGKNAHEACIECQSHYADHKEELAEKSLQFMTKQLHD